MADTHPDLLRKITAQAKTIEVLMDEMDGRQKRRGSAYALIEQNTALEKLVAQKTHELEAAIAELHETQAQRVGAQKLEAIGQLASGIAHEINTPAQYVSDNVTFLMRAFRGLTESLTAYQLLGAAVKAGLPTEAPLAEAEATASRAKLDYLLRQVPRALEQSLEGLTRVTSIVGAMKEFSHPSQGTKAPWDLAEMIQTTLTVSRSEWKYVADVAFDLDAKLEPVPCLRDELNQVFLNLIVNAAHAIAEAKPAQGGRIRVTSRAEANTVIVTIHDNGAGIPEHIQHKVFDPFFTTKPVGKGTGQGLSIARSIVVEAHGGTLAFETEPGQGTAFTIRLPIDGHGEISRPG